VALFSSGEREHAIEILERGREDHPTDPDILLGLATMYRDLSRLPEAIVMAGKLVAVQPENADARRLLDSLRAAHAGGK
jgi:hypothetical protein